MKDLGIVLNGLTRKTFRTLLLVFAIFIAFLIYAVLASFQNSLNAGEDLAGADRLVVTNKINFTQPLPIAYVNRVASITGVDAVSWNMWFGGYYQEPRNFMIAFAVDPESYLEIYKDDFLLPDDQRAAFLADRAGLLVGRSVADQFGWSVGDQVPVKSNIWEQRDGGNTWTFTLRGIYDGPEEQSDTSASFLHYEYFDESRSFGNDTIGNIIVRTTNSDLNERVIEAIDTQFANSAFETRTTTEAAFNAAFVSQLGNIGLIVAGVTGAAFVTVLLIVGNAMAGAIRERTKEIAVMKTLGFSGVRVGRILLGETLIMALIGGALGVLAAFGVTGVLRSFGSFFTNLTMTPEIALMSGGLMVLLGLATGAIPAYLAWRMPIVKALGRE